MPFRLALAAGLTALASLTALAPLSASAAPTRNHYVDCSARHAGDGTSARPWNSLAAVSQHTAFEPGDAILVRRGTTCTGRVHALGSGSPARPIVLGAYGSGTRPTLAGGGTAQFTGVVGLADQHDWVIQDLHITNRTKSAWASTYRSGVLITNTGIGRLANITVQRMAIDDVTSNVAESGGAGSRQWGGISLLTLTQRTANSGFDRVAIMNNTLDHVGRSGIVTWNEGGESAHDRHLRVAGNRVTWTRGDGIVLVGTSDSRIDHNVAAHSSNLEACPNCRPITPATSNAAIWSGHSNRVRIDHNEAYGTHWWGGDGEGFDIDNTAKNVTVEYNYSHDNEGGGVFLCGSINAVVRFNILQNNRKSAFAFIGNVPASGTRIYNNTIYTSKKADAGNIRYFNGPGGSDLKFYNNLVFNHARGYYMWPTKAKSASNTLIGVHKAGAPLAKGGSRRDPDLKAPGTGKVGRNTLKGYKPKHPSAFRRGVAISKSVRTDFFGKPINPKHPPRGAAG